LVGDTVVKLEVLLFRVGVMYPLGRVSYLGIDVLKVNREVDEEEVEVFET